MPRLRMVALLAGLGLAAACGGDDGPAGAPGSASTPPAASPASSPPPSVEPTQNGTYWAVYLAAGDPDSDAFVTRVEMLEARKLPSHGSEAACDQGSREALGLKESDHVIGVYFTTEADARAFAATLDFEPAGIVQVKTDCLD
ncbi:MAG TPA: hypothetical protein VM841_05210 [Actinomycetota bacterium]|nr:hypothetical protein [Actinomycetota bacterium]